MAEHEHAEIAERYTGKPCLLDGKPAKITGRNNQFATVATLPDGPSYVWAWPTVARIMEHDRRFKS